MNRSFYHILYATGNAAAATHTAPAHPPCLKKSLKAAASGIPVGGYSLFLKPVPCFA